MKLLISFLLVLVAWVSLIEAFAPPRSTKSCDTRFAAAIVVSDMMARPQDMEDQRCHIKEEDGTGHDATAISEKGGLNIAPYRFSRERGLEIETIPRMKETKNTRPPVVVTSKVRN